MALAKGSVHKKRSGMAYSIGSKDVMIEGEPESQPVIVWNEELEQTADDLIKEEKGNSPEKQGRPNRQGDLASALLTSMLSGSAGALATDVLAAAAREGISKNTMYRMRDEMGVDSEPTFPGAKTYRWYFAKERQKEKDSRQLATMALANEMAEDVAKHGL
jgi:hypothetical protein